MDKLKQYQCVILTETSQQLQLKVNEFCRNQSPPIKFITADVYGVFCTLFCDFGDSFEVVDQNGEEAKEVFIANITKANPGVVTCLENQMHGLESGNFIIFKEVEGMEKVNSEMYKVKVLSPYAFSICDTTGEDFKPYVTGGRCIEVKQPYVMTFESMEKQLCNPSLTIADLTKMEAPSNIHTGMMALHKYQEQIKRLPQIWNKEDAENLVKIANSLNMSDVDNELICKLAYTCSGCFAPLTAALGGIVAQEGLKALTGKFTPLNQWLYLDVCEVLPDIKTVDLQEFQLRDDRYDGLRICIGDSLCKQLNNLHLFMVGCGAIGCEMLKNYALLGVGASQEGLITITDNDLIEKSNLNRQFLFRPRHIQKPKSSTAAESVLQINPALSIEAMQHKVCPQSEQKIFNDRFFESQDIAVNALDNVEARRYMDSRCVTTQRPLLESGTLAAKGHVQVIIPHMTECYTSQQDPQETDIPYCTLKSFPSSIEHTIQWAREKFESLLSQKPAAFNKFWSSNPDPEAVLKKIGEGQQLEGAVQAIKLLKHRPLTWYNCLQVSRVKFEKYFSNKAKNLLHAFPLDTKLKDGTPFWQSPKRPPTPLEFDSKNPLHCQFVISLSTLLAYVCGIQVREADVKDETVQKILDQISVPEFVPSSKRIETDESAKKPTFGNNLCDDDLQHSGVMLTKLIKDGNAKSNFLVLNPVVFEKDDDTNSHIDFITAASNLRATMYSIDNVDRLKTKRIAGRIVPAIATTTAAVSGLVAVELIKIVRKAPLEHFKNCFLNLALPSLLFSEPGQCAKTVIRPGLSFTLWDKWIVQGREDFKLQDFRKYFKDKFGLEPSMVVHGVKMIFVPIMPGHIKRLPQTMVKLLKPSDSQNYMDLTVAFDSEAGEDVPGPPVRYYFGK
ncbi:ubiquitin-like modifier-activating enzyme 6 isoform X2 [Glandiceps talaboti]